MCDALATKQLEMDALMEAHLNSETRRNQLEEQLTTIEARCHAAEQKAPIPYSSVRLLTNVWLSL